MPDPTKARFAYRISFADYVAMHEARWRLGLFGRFARPARYMLWYLIMIAVVTATVWPSLDGGPIHWHGLLEREVLPWIAVMLAFPFVWDLVYSQVVLRWYFRNNAAAQHELHVALDEDGVRWTMGASEGRWNWTMTAHKLVVGDRAFLFLDKLQAIILPRRGLAEGDWDGVLALIARKTN